jgi:hypothetical protein
MPSAQQRSFSQRILVKLPATSAIVLFVIAPGLWVWLSSAPSARWRIKRCPDLEEFFVSVGLCKPAINWRTNKVDLWPDQSNVFWLLAFLRVSQTALNGVILLVGIHFPARYQHSTRKGRVQHNLQHKLSLLNCRRVYTNIEILPLPRNWKVTPSRRVIVSSLKYVPGRTIFVFPNCAAIAAAKTEANGLSSR